MPYRSKAQQRYFNWKAGTEGGEWAERAQHWNEATKGVKRGKKKGFKALPERVEKSAVGAAVTRANDAGWLKPLAVGTVAGALANQIPPVQNIRREEKKRKKGKVQKMLVPAHDDPYFNQEAAQAAFDLVMKMDDESAAVFCHIVVSDLFEQDMENNLGTLQRHLNEVIAKRVTDLKRAHIRLVSKGYDAEASIAYAQAIALLDTEISKDKKQKGIGASQKYGYVWREEDFSRDPSSGRFRMKISHNQTKPLHEKTAQSLLGVSTPTHHPDNDKQKLTPLQQAHFQDEYRQLADFLSAVNESSSSAGNQEVLLHYRDKAGRQFSTIHTGTLPPTKDLSNPDFRLMGVEAKPTTLTAGGAAFGLATALGGNLNPAQVKAINAADTESTQFANDWLRAGDESGKASNQRLYDRMSAGGKFLSEVAPKGSKAHLAGRFAEVIGSRGPEAEAVLGPSARKTAYRYRGTEKAPDKKLVEAYSDAITQGKLRGPVAVEEGPLRRGAKPVRTGRRPVPEVAPPASRMAAIRQAREERAPSWEERDEGRQVVVEYLRSRMPSKQLYGLQLASGNTPPSEGVILNADGQIAAQAVGYGDDHYLPFNLKNLGALKGGEYIRTRSVGGLTAEDIYTGLIAGARQVTVTSRSGTYTVTFEPDFRGGRRHNDKARRMTRRYEQILDAVQSQQVDRTEIDPGVRSEIEREVKEQMSGPGWKRSDIQDAIKERVDEFKERPYITDKDEERAERMIASASAGLGDSDRDQREKDKIRQEIYDKLLDDKEVKFRLNSSGYAAAQDALAEQFPYYLGKPKWTGPRFAEQRISTERDLGYVEPGRNRPTAAAAGLFGGAQKPHYARMGGKFSASEADYQGVRSVPRGGAPRTAKDIEGTAATTSTKDVHTERAERAAQARIDEDLVAAAKEVQQHAKTEGLREEDQKLSDNARYLNMTEEQLRDPAGMRGFIEWANRYTNLPGLTDDDVVGGWAIKRRWQGAVGQRNRKPYDKASASLWPQQAPLFEDDEAYALHATAKQRAEELGRRDRISIVHGVPQSRLTDDQLRGDWSKLVQMREELERRPEEKITRADLESLRLDPSNPALSGDILRSTKAIDRRIEDIQRTRALLLRMDEPERQAYEDAQEKKSAVRQPTQTAEERAAMGDTAKSSLEYANRVLRSLPDKDSDDADKVRGLIATMEQGAKDIKDEQDKEMYQQTIREHPDFQLLLRLGHQHLPKTS